MADLGNTFDPTEVPESDRNFDPLPAGEYLCQVIESDLLDLKSGKGQMLKLTIEVMDGPFVNRKIWDQLNIRHESADAQRIAQRALADLCAAVGVGRIRNSDELHFKRFIARLGIREDKTGQYEPQNVVKRYRPVSGAPPAEKPPTNHAPQTASPPPQTARPAAHRPWAKNA